MTSDDAVGILDRAETAPVSTVLLLVDADDALAVVEESRRAGPGEAFDHVHLVVMIQAGDSHALVGGDGDRPPAVRAAFTWRPTPPRAVASHPLAPLPTQKSIVTRSRAAAVAGAVALVVAGGSWLALDRGPRPTTPGHGATPPSPAAIAAAILPEPRYSPTVVYDSERQNTVLFGGGEPSTTTWLWSRQIWTAVTSSTSPSDRFGSAAAYDPLLKKVLLFGGREIPGNVPNDTWAWDGRAWARLAASSLAGPPGYEYSVMAWDEARQEMVLLTGPASPGESVATWTWAGDHWKPMPVAVQPPTLATTMAFDQATQSVLLLTSSQSASPAPSTWSWDGTT